MRKIIFVVLAVASIMLAGCGNTQKYEGYPQASEPAETPQITQAEATEQLEEFSFRGHKFWDSLEQVIEKEGEPDRDKTYDEEYAYTIFYNDVDIFGYKSELSFSFIDEKLHDILVNIYNFDIGSTIEERYHYFKNKLVDIGGEPDEEIIDEEIIGLWINVDLDYAITLYSSDERLSFGMRAVPKVNEN